jgi:amino acid transporter
MRATEDPVGGRGLIRAIGPWALTAFAINATVGAGIFGLPARIHALVGNYSVLVILLCALLIALIALCFAELGSRFDRTGGPQLYATIAYGPVTGFTVGWLVWVSRSASTAAISNLLVDYSVGFWPQLEGPLPRVLLIATVIAAYTWINLRGVREAATVSTAFTIAKLIPLLAFVGAGLLLLDLGAPFPESLPATSDVATAVLLMTFAFFGFDATTIVAGEVRQAHRSIPFAILVAVGSVATLYALIQLVCIAALPDLAAAKRPLADAAQSFAGPGGALAISVGAVISCIGIIGVLLTTATRALFAMGESGQLPAIVGRIHPRFHTPHWAIATTSAVVLTLALSGTFIYLVKLTLIARIVVFAATCAAVPVMRRRAELPAASFKVPAGGLLGWICCALCLLFLARSSMGEMLDVAVAAALGLLIFGIARAMRARLHNG